MSYVNVSSYISAITDQKRKYHAKVLSDDAIDITFQRIMDVGDILQLNVWLRIPEIAWTALGLSVLYDMPPIAFEPLRITFDVEIPHIVVKMPRWLLEKLHEVDIKTAVRLLLENLPRVDIDKILRILAPNMTLEDVVNILREMYPPELLVNLPEIVEVWLPDWNAFFHGVYLWIRTFKLDELFDWMDDIDEYILRNFRVRIERPRKCIYGVSRYGRCFCDPTLWQAFVTSTLLKAGAKYNARTTFKAAMDSLSKTANININVVKYLHDRMEMVASAQLDTFILGYSLLGRSKLTPKENGKAVLNIMTYDGQEITLRFDNLAQLQFGFILGLTPLGHGLLVPREDPYIRRVVKLQGVHETEGGPPAEELVDFKARRVIRQAVYTPMVLVNYQRPDERADALRSERTNMYDELMQFYNMLDNIVDPILERHGVDKWRKRVYKNAVRQLVGYKAKRHEWGYEAFKVMDENTFMQWWIDYWAGQGLNKEILQELYNTVARWLDTWRRTKYNLGASLRKQRLRLAGLSP